MYGSRAKKSLAPKAGIAAAAMAACFCLAGTAQAWASSAATVPTPGERRLQSTLSSTAFLNVEARGAMDTAIKFVRYTGLSKNLSLLLLHDVKDDAPVQGAIDKYGMKKVQGTVVKAIKAEQHKYSISWDQMLAGVYMQHFTTNELNSILAKREASPFFDRLLELQTVISEEIQENGKDIYVKARAGVMKQVSKQLPLT